jgi:hypothetical protein
VVEFGFLAAPARRALASAGVARVADLAGHRETDVAAWHGMGPNAMRKLKEEMARQGLRFAG